MALQKIDIQTLSFNPFTKISQEWRFSVPVPRIMRVR